MSDFFDDKQYNDYFLKLNNRLTAEKEANSATVMPLKEDRKSAPVKRKKGIYKVFRLKKRVLLSLVAVAVVIILIIVLSLKGCGNESKTETENAIIHGTVQKAEDRPKNIKISYNEDKNTLTIPESNDAKTAIIIRKSDNKIVAQRNPHKKVYPASTLKVMTLITAVEYIKDFNDTFTMSLKITDPLYIAKASVAGFANKETVTMTDLLYGMILPSGADAAMGLAVKIAGSEEDFVVLMNRKARSMGLKNTHFTNVSGLYDKNNYSSAYDMAIITDYAMQNELCRKILSTLDYTTSATPQHPEGIKLTSTLFGSMYGTEPETATVLGGKTGFVNEAGYCITSFGRCNNSGEEYIVVTMGNASLWPAIFGQIDLYKEFVK